MIKISRFAITLVVLLLSVSSYGQNKIIYQVEYNHLFGIRETGVWDIERGLNGFDINVTSLYNVNESLALGLGIGALQLRSPEYTMVPIFTKAVLAPFKRDKRPFLYTKLGYSVGISNSKGGFLINPGVGFRVQMLENISLDFLLGYCLQTINVYLTEPFDSSKVILDGNNMRRSISLAFGVTF